MAADPRDEHQQLRSDVKPSWTASRRLQASTRTAGLYASRGTNDDLVLVSLSESGLQAQLHALHAFCMNRGLTVNLAKTKAVVFNQRTYKTNLVLAGQAVEQVDVYKFLELVMHQNGTFTCAVESRKSAAQRALFALQARCAELGIVDTQLRCKLYDAVVKPVLSYGCEVWVPLVSDTSLEELERVHLSFLRRILHVPRATAAKHLYAETAPQNFLVAAKPQIYATLHT